MYWEAFILLKYLMIINTCQLGSGADVNLLDFARCD